MKQFDYSKPKMEDYSLSVVSGASCYIDCNGDDICGTGADEF